MWRLRGRIKMSELLSFIRNPLCWKNNLVPEELLTEEDFKVENKRIEEMMYIDSTMEGGKI